MNERIKELVEQAEDHARAYIADCKTYGYYMEHNEYELEFQKKFAELIIDEIEQELKSMAEWYSNNNNYVAENTCYNLINHLNKKFGSNK